MDMKHIYALAACLILAAGCADRYEEHYSHIAVDSNYLRATKDAQTVPVMVYYDGSWKASVPEQDWAVLDRTSGKGIGGLHLQLEENMLEERSLDLTLIGGRDTVVVTIEQARGY